MLMKREKARRSILFFGLVISSALVFSSFAAASPRGLSRVRDGIWNHRARWVAGETSISKLPSTQRMKRLGLKMHAVNVPQSSLAAVSSPAVSSGTLPTVLDYRNYNGFDYVTSVKDQGNCGSCWAFATTAALESQVLMNNKENTDEAEQILVSCSGAGNCNGGYIDQASTFIERTGLPAESCFPYTGTNSTCSSALCPSWQSDTYTISNWQWVATTSPTVDALKNALYNYGPLVTTMNVYSDFFYYTGGVYSYTSGKYQGGHAIEVIGWDDDAQAFICKNSWGTGWGESGFFYIAYSQLTTGVQFGDYTIAYTGSNNIVSQCDYTIYPTSASYGSDGGSGTVSVSSQSGCDWSATSDKGWLTIISGASGSADGTVSYSVSANTSRKNRTGHLTIGGQTFTVTQGKPARGGRNKWRRWWRR